MGGYGFRVPVEISVHFRLEMRRLIQNMKQKNVRIIFSWPPTANTKIWSVDHVMFKETLAKIEKFLKAEGIEIAARPRDFNFPQNYFFDTHYHLNEEGKKHRTRVLAAKLKEVLTKKDR